MNTLDRFIGYFAPGAALRRVAARDAISAFSNRYEAARIDRALDGWWTTGADPNVEISGQLARIRQRTRDLARNEPYVARAYDILTAKMVGTGIRPRLPHSVPGQIRTRLNDEWKRWTDEADIEGENDIYGIQAIATRSMVESGAALIEAVPLPGRGRRIPWGLRVLEPDWIDMDQHRGLEDGGAIINGIEFDAAGVRRAYHLFGYHPGSDVFTTRTPNSRRVPAENIAHLFRPQRPGQVHGVPWAAPIAARVKNLDDLTDARIKRAKIQACFAAFVRQSDPTTPRGATETVNGQRREQLAPGMIEYLQPDEEISFANPPSGEDDDAWTKTMVHGVAAGLGVTYAQMTGDLSDANYSSMRAGSIDQWDLLNQWQNLILVPKMCRPMWRTFDRVASAMQRRNSSVVVEWDFPERQFIDPQKDGAAIDEALLAGRRTFSEVIASRGKDPKAHVEDLKMERGELEELNLPHIVPDAPEPVAITPEEQPATPPAPTNGNGNYLDA